MSNTLGIGIKVDPGDAAAKAKGVQDALAGAEDQGKKTQKAFDGLTDTFKRIGEYQRLLATEAASMNRVMGNVAGSFKGVADAMRAEALNGTAKAFAGVTEQLQREAAMLDKIHGPAKQLQADLQTLEMLYKRGSISAGEYTDQLQKMGQMHGPNASQAGSEKANDFTDSLKGNIAGIVGPAAMAGVALHAITEELGNWKAREQDVRDATNSILKFHGSIEGASNAMEEQRSISDALAVNIKTTTHAYADVREATEDLGLSSKQMADITRNLSADLLVDGGSIEQVSDIMGKLRYSLEAGTMGSRELKAIWQQSPEVAESFARSIGKTYPELMRMAKEGKITTTQIEAFVKGIGEGHEGLDKYRQRLMDVDRVMGENHENFVDAGLAIMKAKQQYEDLGESATQAMDRILHATTHNVVSLEQMADKVQLIMSAINVQGRFASDKTLIDNGLKVSELLLSQKDEWTQYRSQLADARKEMERAGYSAKQVAEGLAQIHPPGWVDYYKQELDAIENPQKNFNGGVAALHSMLDSGRISLAQYTAEWNKLFNTFAGGDIAKILNFTPRSTAKHEPYVGYDDDQVTSAGADRMYDDLLKQQSDSPSGLDAEVAGTTTAQDQWAKLKEMGDIGKNSMTDYDRALEKHQRELDAVTEHMKPLETAIDQFTKTGKFDWKTMIDSWISDLERLGENQLFGALFGALSGGPGLGSFASSLGGSMTSGVDSGGPAPEFTSLFGGAHAFGGSYVAPSTGGGQDSISAMFRISPGERVDFTPPGMAPRGGGNDGGSAPPVQVHLIQHQDRGLSRSPQDVVQVVLDDVARNPGRWRALIPSR